MTRPPSEQIDIAPPSCLAERTKAFAIRVLRLVDALPTSAAGQVVARQLAKSGTSIGANYREAKRASSRKHFRTTILICLREAEETAYWLEVACESGMVQPPRIEGLLNECEQLIRIFAASAKTAGQPRADVSK